MTGVETRNGAGVIGRGRNAYPQVTMSRGPAAAEASFER